jgi:hypothetical protein
MYRLYSFLLVAIYSVCAQAADVPVLFDNFQAPLESLASWQNFRAAHTIGFVDNPSLAGGRAVRVQGHFSRGNSEAVLIWRFPDVQMKKFRARILIPESVPAGDVYFQVIANNTKGDAFFFKPFIQGDVRIELPYRTREGIKKQPAAPLPRGKWIIYEARCPEDVFYEQKRTEASRNTQDFSLMNTTRSALNLSVESRPATEALFLSFQILEDSPLIGKDVEFYLDWVEIY